MLTQEALKSVLTYEPVTGEFRWAVQLSPVAPVGSVAGTIYANGRRYITIGRKRYFASQLAWLYVYGTFPSQQIDHINLIRDDDRIANLRLATAQQNAANRRVSRNNRLGVKGVSQRGPSSYRARIRVNDRLINLGQFPTAAAAGEAYVKAAEQFFGAFARSV